MLDSPIQVYIVDDESSVCVAYSRLMRSARMQPQTFSSVEEFIRSEIKDENSCVVCDVQFPGKSGFELPILLGRAGHYLPVIFVTAHDNTESRDMAKRLGAAAYLRKPIHDQELLDAIHQAVERHRSSS